jgi:hypothetical protein
MAPARMKQGPSPEVVDVYAARGFQGGFSFILFPLSFSLEAITTEICRIHAET